MVRNFKRAGEMYAFLIGTIIGLLIIGAMFFGYGIYKSGTSNSVAYTALSNQDVSKLSSTRVNNAIEFDTQDYIYATSIDDLKTGTLSGTLIDTNADGKAIVFVVDSQNTLGKASPERISESEYLSISNDDLVTGFIVKGVAPTDVRVPKYFKTPVSSNLASLTGALLQAN